MKFATPILLATIALFAPTAFAAKRIPTLPPVQLRIICTVPTPWDVQACWVEFEGYIPSRKVEVASQAEAEKLVALLLEYSGRRYEFEARCPIKSRPLPAELSPVP